MKDVEEEAWSGERRKDAEQADREWKVETNLSQVFHEIPCR